MRVRHGTAVHHLALASPFRGDFEAGKDYSILGVDEFARVCNLIAGITDEH